MEIQLNDKVLLKNGETAHIVEIYKQGVAYEGEINKQDGDLNTDLIKQEDIEMIIKQSS
jgi:hypothetical protein